MGAGGGWAASKGGNGNATSKGAGRVGTRRGGRVAKTHSRKGVLDTSVASSKLLRNHVCVGRREDVCPTTEPLKVAARTERAGY